ncbi:MAG: cell division protein FtsA [Candidatus Zixiibacteriota bacterium]|nr:MAG: cell division protein FtsA [candidate division Zixibacteria bacterium]
MSDGTIITGLDIGTTKVGVIIGEPAESGSFRILGVGTAPSEGLKKGVVVNLEKAVDSVKSAIDDAELVTGKKIENVYASISGDHIKSINSRGVIAIGKTGSEIALSDVERAIEAAKTVAIPSDREIIHVLPQEYKVDDQDGIRDPIGFSGVRLEVDVHIVTGSVSAAQNVLRCIEKSGIGVEELVLQSLASSYAVLTKDEMELGCMAIDMGGGTTDLAVFHEGSVKHTAVIGIGGKNVTGDLAIGLRTPLEQAEQLKCNYGSALSSSVDASEMVIVPGVAGRESKEVSRSVLASIIEPRMEEIFSLVARELKKSHFTEMLAAGVVLTGGAAQLDGVLELAEQIFDLPAKLGTPLQYDNNTEITPGPAFSTGIGAIHYALSRSEKIAIRSRPRGLAKTIDKMKKWFDEYF